MAERVFVLPDPGEGLTEAEVVAWLVAEGDTVELNQPLAEVETAKALVEIPSPYAGVVVRLHAEAGGSVAVGEALVTFAVDGGGSASTPAVRRLARDLGVDVGSVAGTGPSGRVTADDVRRVAGSGSAPLGAVATGDGGEVRGLDPVRRAIGRVLTEQAAIPQVTTFRTVDCTALEDVRRDLDVSPLPVVAAALCRTIEAHPLLNSAWADEGILVRGSVDIAIATDTERGLMVPVVRDAGRRGIGDLASEVRRVADIARAGRLTRADTADATIGLSNTGSYGSEAGTPILTPGAAVTLAIGVIAPRALVVDGEVVARPACTLSLTFDHRVLDGAAAGRALTDLVALLQDPARLRDLPR